MAENLKPLVLSSDGKKHTSAQPGDKLDSSYIDKKGLISDKSGNLLSVDTNGKLFVSSNASTAADLISSSLGNSITLGADKKLYAKAVSTDANNLVKRGGDNGAHLEATDIISAGSTENLISVNPVDHRIQVTESDVKRAVGAVSENLTERVAANESAIAVLKTNTVAITVSNVKVNPTSLKLGEGVLYPAENLL